MPNLTSANFRVKSVVFRVTARFKPTIGRGGRRVPRAGAHLLRGAAAALSFPGVSGVRTGASTIQANPCFSPVVRPRSQRAPRAPGNTGAHTASPSLFKGLQTVTHPFRESAACSHPLHPSFIIRGVSASRAAPKSLHTSEKCCPDAPLWVTAGAERRHGRVRSRRARNVPGGCNRLRQRGEGGTNAPPGKPGAGGVLLDKGWRGGGDSPVRR
jgi:hypothetical protein